MPSPGDRHIDVQPTPLLIATRNPGKSAELRALFASARYAVLDLAAAGVLPTPAEESIEAFDTFEENALAKARFYHLASGGRATVADDSGLVVDALDGAPGVRSRRWAGSFEGDETLANNAKLVAALEGVVDRRARFVCVAAYIDGRGSFLERGETFGRIAPSARGTAGFGYDPLFESADLDWRTFGEVDAADKARVSHRTRAFVCVARRLQRRAGDWGS